jgi:inhibitor of KinA sporulation pathway (predicted exonuclease)
MKLDEIITPENLLVVDVEATCWETEKEKGNQKNEVIEIGAAVISDGHVGNVTSILIKPQFSKVSEFCTKLTSLTQKEVDSGYEPKAAYHRLQALFNSGTWASYGLYDKKILTEMAALYKINLSLPPNHINVRELYAKIALKSNDIYVAPSNPRDAMEKIGMEFKGKNHRGDDDAFNIARLYLELERRRNSLSIA